MYKYHLSMYRNQAYVKTIESTNLIVVHFLETQKCVHKWITLPCDLWILLNEFTFVNIYNSLL